MIQASDSDSSGRYIVDGDGNRVGVILDYERFCELVEAAEELEAIREYDAAKALDDEAIPFEQAIDEIERQRP